MFVSEDIHGPGDTTNRSRDTSSSHPRDASFVGSTVEPMSLKATCHSLLHAAGASEWAVALIDSPWPANSWWAPLALGSMSLSQDAELNTSGGQSDRTSESMDLHWISILSSSNPNAYDPIPAVISNMDKQERDIHKAMPSKWSSSLDMAVQSAHAALSSPEQSSRNQLVEVALAEDGTARERDSSRPDHSNTMSLSSSSSSGRDITIPGTPSHQVQQEEPIPDTSSCGCFPFLWCASTAPPARERDDRLRTHSSRFTDDGASSSGSAPGFLYTVSGSVPASARDVGGPMSANVDPNRSFGTSQGRNIAPRFRLVPRSISLQASPSDTKQANHANNSMLGPLIRMLEHVIAAGAAVSA